MNVKLLAIIAAAGLGLYLVLKPSAGAAAVQKGAKNSGIGGASSKAGNVAGFPLGSLVQSITSFGTSILGGAGTHSPVDPTIRAPGATGSIITSYDQLNPPSPVPASSVIQTQLDDYNPNASYWPSQDATVAAEDYWVD